MEIVLFDVFAVLFFLLFLSVMGAIAKGARALERIAAVLEQAQERKS